MRETARPTGGSARGMRNTTAMLDAALHILAETGWAGLSITATAERMGTSIRPVRSRVPDRGALVATVWRQRLESDLLEALTQILAAVSAGDAPAIAQALTGLRTNDNQHSALAETLIVARYDPAVREAVDGSLGEFVRARTTPRGRVTAPDAARASYVIQLGLGLQLASRFPRMQADLSVPLAEVAAALCRDTDPTALPTLSATHIDEFPVLAPDDPILEEVLRATLTLVSEKGYEGATVVDIAASADVTEGFVFGRYDSKRALLADALSRQQDAGWALNAAFVESVTAQTTSGITAAVLMREILKPGRDLGRDMALELLRLSWHDAAMLEETFRSMDAADTSGGTDPRFSLDSALDFGTYLLPRLAPASWTLPMDVVTVPLQLLRDGSA